MQNICELRLPVSCPGGYGFEIYVVEHDALFGHELGMPIGRDVDDADRAGGGGGHGGEQGGEEELGQEKVGNVVHLASVRKYVAVLMKRDGTHGELDLEAFLRLAIRCAHDLFPISHCYHRANSHQSRYSLQHY